MLEDSAILRSVDFAVESPLDFKFDALMTLLETRVGSWS